jgi:hypothetical protein
MVHDAADKPAEQPSSPTGLAPERAANLATDNQSAAAKPDSTPGKLSVGDYMWMAAASDGMMIPPFEYPGVNGGSNQINDCSKGGCTVNGKDYKDSTQIPGNYPKELLHNDGSPVLGPDGKAVYGPDRVDLDKVAAEARDTSTPMALLNFVHSGKWDFQRVRSDSGAPIWTEKYQNFSNIGIGYVLGAKGMKVDDMAKWADRYCSVFCNYSEPRSKEYPNLADRQVKDFQIGLALYRERHPGAK